MASGKSSWWSQRTPLEKRLTIFCTIFALLAVGFLIGLIVVAVNNNSTSDTSERVCLTEACVKEASNVLAQMNENHDPCDDFYEFACGTFLRETVIPDDKTTVTAFSVIENEMKDQLREIVEKPIDINEIKVFQDVKKLYISCMNTMLIEDLGVVPVRNAIDTMGGWPVLEDSWNGLDWTWSSSVQKARENGYSTNYFMSLAVTTDSRNSTRRIIRIDQTSLGLSREYILNESLPFFQAYREYQVDLALLFNSSLNSDVVRTQMQEALDFEIQLANISLSREDRRDAERLYNPMSIRELQSNASFTYRDHNWLSYFNSILPEESLLNEDDVVIVGAVSFFEKLGDLLANTDNRVMANYVAWRHAFASVNYLSSVFRERQLQYDTILTGRAVANPRWLECVDTTLAFYPLAFGALYVREHFRPEAKDRALEMVNNIQDEFKIMLSEIDWMDDGTKTNARAKAESIRSEIGFADELMDDEKLTEYYSLVPADVHEDQYYQSIVNLNKAGAYRTNRRLREAINKTEWSSHVAPAIVNAYYSSLENRIAFPAGILQGAFFNSERPQYMNYGGIGFVIGHEITHGFDDQGSQYDADGNLRNWWANDTRDAYLEKANCIIYQYGNYTEPLTNLPLNGINTQGENIADNGGIKESYRAYNRWAVNNSERLMPGLTKYTPQQMFWISAGQVWCSLYREESMANRVLTGVHSPGQFRVIGPMSNMKEFSDDFQCGPQSRMNREPKCEVW